MVVLDLCEAAVGFERFCLLELCILLELFEGGFASTLVARSKVDQEGAVVERRFGVLEGQLADNCEADTLRMLVVPNKL